MRPRGRTDASSLTDAGGQPTTRIAWVCSWRPSSAANGADGSKSRPDVVVRRVLLNGGLLLGSATTRGARWAHARRDHSVTTGRAERKTTTSADSSSVDTRRTHPDCPIARVHGTNALSAIADCSPLSDPESATKSATGGGNGNETAPKTGSGTVSAARAASTLVAHVALSRRPAPKLLATEPCEGVNVVGSGKPDNVQRRGISLGSPSACETWMGCRAYVGDFVRGVSEQAYRISLTNPLMTYDCVRRLARRDRHGGDSKLARRPDSGADRRRAHRRPDAHSAARGRDGHDGGGVESAFGSTA